MRPIFRLSNVVHIHDNSKPKGDRSMKYFIDTHDKAKGTFPPVELTPEQFFANFDALDEAGREVSCFRSPNGENGAVSCFRSRSASSRVSPSPAPECACQSQ